jgi:hypothetical protein
MAPNAGLALPRGKVVSFKFVGHGDVEVMWEGAENISRSRRSSVAECALTLPGTMEVKVSARASNGEVEGRVCRFTVLDVSVDDIVIKDVQLTADAPVFGVGNGGGQKDQPDIQPTSVNDRTMEYFFSQNPITPVTEIAPGRFVTATNQLVHLKMEVEPPQMAAMMEWRIAGEAALLGNEKTRRFGRQHTTALSAGPVDRPYQAVIETFSSFITSHKTGADRVVDGNRTTFVARTDPPGYERYVTWLASTKYGSTDPIMGEGKTFAVTFRDTWGPDPETGEPFQWLGVKADYATFDQDQKLAAPVITDVTPLSGWAGTIVTVTGLNFGTDPDGLCALLCRVVNDSTSELVGCRVLSAANTTATVEIGFPRPGLNGVGMSFMMARGIGGTFALAPEDSVTVPPTWVWGHNSNLDPEAATAPNLWIPVAPASATSPATLAITCPGGDYHSAFPCPTPPDDQTLEIMIPAGWGAGTEVSIQARIGVFDLAAGTKKSDSLVKPTFTFGGDAERVARKICRILKNAFATHPDPTRRINIDCEVVVGGPPVCGLTPPAPPGGVYIRIEPVNQDLLIISGGIDICVNPTVVP